MDANTLRIEFAPPPDAEPSGGVGSSTDLGPADADVERQSLERRHAELMADFEAKAAEFDRRRALTPEDVDEVGGDLEDELSALADEINDIRRRLAGAGDDELAPIEATGAEEVKGPTQVELTPENAQLVADLLAGKITEDEFEAAVQQTGAGGGSGGEEPPDINDILPDPGDPFDTPGDPLFPEARRVPRAKPVVPFGGDEEIQSDLERQHRERQKQEAAQQAAGAATGETDLTKVIPAVMGGDLAGAGAALGVDAAALAALGPVAAVAGVVVLAGKQLQENLAAVGEGMRSVAVASGDAATALARNDPSALRDQLFETEAAAFDAANEMLGGMSPAFKALSEGAKTVGATFDTAERVLAAFVARGKELSGLDSRLAVATANADVQRLQDDLREANRTGEDLARLTRSSSQIESFQRELLTLVKTELIAALADFLEPVGEIAADLKMLTSAAADINDATKEGRQAVRGFASAGLVRVVRLVGMGMEKILDRLGVQTKPQNTLLDEVFKAGQNVPIGSPINQTVPPVGQGPVGPLTTWFNEPS